MEFGNWRITDQAIEWSGGGPLFSAQRSSLTRTRPGRETALYEWVLQATSEDWLSEDDLYDFNFAFVYAAAKWNLPFNYEIFDATLEEQFDMLELENDEEA